MKKQYAVIFLVLLPLLIFAKLPSAGIRVFPNGNSSISRLPAYPLLNIYGREKDPPMDWKDIDNYQYIYYDEDSFYPDKIVECSMDYSLGDWVAHTVHEITYNSDMRVVEIASGTPLLDGMIMESLFEIGYDEEGNLQFADISEIDESGEFLPSMFFDFVLEQNGECATYLTMVFGAMVLNAVIDIDLDAQGRMICETTSVSMDQENWEFQDKSEHTYHPDDTTTFQDLLDYFNENWALNSVIGFGDTPGMHTQRMDYIYSDGEWVYKRKFERSYINGKIADEVEYDYDDGAWTPQSKQLYSYNIFGDLASQINQYPNGAGGFDDHFKYDFVYDLPVSAEDTVQSPSPVIAISAWPMPFKDAINIRIDSKELSEHELEIFNLKGQLVNKLQTHGKNDTLWDGKDLHGKALPAGIYFLRASSDKAFRTQKIIKLR